MIVLGLASGISFPAFGNASLHEVTGQDSSLASGVQNAMQQIGGALGLATLATLAIRHAEDKVAEGVLPPVASVEGTELAFLVGTGMCVIGGILVLVLLEHVIAQPRNPLAEEAEAAEVTA